MVQTTVRLLHNTIREANSALIKGESSVKKLCRESIRLLDEEDVLNSFITVCRRESLDVAEQLDQRMSNTNGLASHHDGTEIKKRPLDNPRLNPLYGIPVSIKDNFCTKQLLTTCGSKMLYNFVPNYNATAVERLQKANCLVMGKTNMDEFAMGSSSTTSYYGPTANHWKRDLLGNQKPAQAAPKNWFMAGGSSSGSATSVASKSCFASLGTDTGGSTRQPASMTGTVGFKPSYGLISRFGLVPLAHSLDVVSILARNVDDVHLVFNAVVGQDERDLTSVDYKKELKSKLTQMLSRQPEVITIRVGIPRDFIARAEMATDVSNLFDRFARDLSSTTISMDSGTTSIKFELVKLDLEYSRSATECYAILSSCEIASNMSCFDGVKFGYSTTATAKAAANNSSKEGDNLLFDRDQFYQTNRDEAFGPEVKKRILLGNYFLLGENREKYLSHALRLRGCISDEFNKAFNEQNVDIILTPSTPTTSVSHEEWLAKQKDNKLFHEDYFLIPSNMANLPSISLPTALSTAGLPIGVQVIANKFHDLDLLFVSRIFEQKLLHFDSRPC